jgi:hypothetical protein
MALLGCAALLGCTEPNPDYQPGSDGSGGCTPGDRQCAGQITQVCSGARTFLNERQCPDGTTCNAGVCVTTGVPCTSDEGCGEGQVCTIFVRPDDPTKLGTFCSANLGETAGGKACTSHLDCQSGFCLKRIGMSFCYKACDGQKSCSELMYRCVQVLMTVNGVQGSVHACAPR